MEKLGAFPESRIGTINAVVFGSKQASHGSLVGNHERITVEIISELGRKTAPD
jgi:hypothetical protein